MKLLKPSWVHHDEKPIFSVDVHQECLKFATGGQGVDSGRVVIWNLIPVLSEKAELDENVPKMLCQMDNHLACVNCVRWSQSGLMLASCSDDKLVMIWRQSKGPSGVFGTGGIHKNPESWKCVFTLRGHSGDVLDLAWSPQDRWLASCSIDNTIIVWDAQNFPAMVAMLKGHTGLVKGVAWDPVGKYLASQSDDRSVKIWKTSDWTCSSTITEPFEECGGTTHILRLSWSPDGQYLVSAHAMNGGGPTAQIIEREGWKCDKDFVGHRKAVTCVRFHTAILKRQAPKSQKPQQYCCLAVGSRDRSLSVWMTALQRPLVVIHELFNDSILDLSWGPDKCILMACSGDGTVACLQFSENELGTPLSEEDKNTLYQRIYGKTAAILTNGSSAATDLLIENPELLTCTQDKIKPPTLPTIQVTNHNNNIENSLTQAAANGFGYGSRSSTSTQNANAMEIGQSTPIKAINKQMETRTKDGKRRITPVFIPLNQDVAQTNTTTNTNSSSFAQATTEVTGSASMPSEGEAVIASTSSASMKDSTTSPGSSANTLPKTNITDQERGRLDSRLVKSSTAKPRVEPFTVSKDNFQSFPNFKQTPQHFSNDDKTSATTSNAASATKSYQASTMGPKINITATTKCEYQKTALDYRVHVSNGCVPTNNGLLAKVTAFRLATGKLWETFVGSPVVNFNFCLKCVMLCSLDGSMRLLDLQTGSPLMPIISLTTAAIQCAFCPKGLLVGVITECGLLRIWNIATCSAVLATTCNEIFGKHGSVLQFTITEQGVPMILFSNGQAFSYSAQLQSWLVLNTKDPIMRHGLRTSIPKELNKNYLCYPLTSIQAATTTFVTQSTGIDLNANDWQSVAKISFIENQIKLCEAINSAEELKYWYTMLAFHLAIGNNENKLRLLLNDLLGTGTRSISSQNEYILNISKHEILDLVLEQLKVHIKWQRIYMEYNELYQQLKIRRQAKLKKQQQQQEQEQQILQETEKEKSVNLTTKSPEENDAAAAITTSSNSSLNCAKLETRMDIT
ncbi:HIRA-like protein [Lucilia cuprina]|uniref:Protein HIRA n=1 Tax=Lucilia cuprina TaxID=7375 RepID=A0A0L0C933_LUCCU|nr:Protein HIRA like protein [Lucilia cuprina]KNC28791.1 HIRA-like protein [Lucilia cuprina]